MKGYSRKYSACSNKAQKSAAAERYSAANCRDRTACNHLAEQLTERVERLAQLQTRMSERSSKRLQFEEKRKQLQEKYAEREDIADYLRKAEDVIAKIEEHRQEAEELPTLQSQHEQLSAQQHRLEGNIEGFMKSRKLSAGGQCPLLHEPCLNIQTEGYCQP